MKALIGFLAISLTFASSALAMSVFSSEDNDLRNAPCTTSEDCNTDYFGKLESLFAQGTVPSKLDVVGWHSGRCFLASAHTDAIASLIVGLDETMLGTNGPLFSGAGDEVLKFFLLTNDSHAAAAANIFDHLNSTITNEFNSTIEREVMKIVKLIEEAVQAAGLQDHSLSVSYGNRDVWQMRKTQNYLLIRAMSNNSVQAFCYFFKKVK